ncbi:MULTISPECIES: hypothetical protein [unclassified Moraxella]|uniref:hypothetical protein n=1 Tax=unclassified Moraxella TaxID=2685852 RepID=UPI002B40C6EE|nr:MULTISPECIES: hypothetical protein [unclassified Moraxella]
MKPLFLIAALGLASIATIAHAENRNGPYKLDRCYAEEGELEPYKESGYNLCSQEARSLLDTIVSQVKKPNFNKDYVFGRIKYTIKDGSNRTGYNQVAINLKTKQTYVLPYTVILPKGEVPSWSFNEKSNKICLLNDDVIMSNVGNHWSYSYDNEILPDERANCFSLYKHDYDGVFGFYSK